MNNIHFLLGGVRSGKSRAAQEMACAHSRVLYIATANAKDAGMKARIARHRSDRPQSWETLEAYRDFSRYAKLFREKEFLIFDCLTLMLSRLLFEQEESVEHFEWPQDVVEKVEKKIFAQVDELLEAIGETPCAIVGNEVGLGVVPESWLGNYFRDISGRVNQYIAAKAKSVTLMVAGIALPVKKGEE